MSVLTTLFIIDLQPSPRTAVLITLTGVAKAFYLKLSQSPQPMTAAEPMTNGIQLKFKLVIV